MKKFSKILYSIFSLIIIFAFLITPIKALVEEDVYLSLDVENVSKLPNHFRKTSDLSVLKNSTENLKGLSTLNISGSKQFSDKSLSLIIENLSQPKITVIDLRQESHGFINGNAVSWLGDGNNANAGLTLEEVVAKEDSQLKSIPLNKPIKLSKGKYTLVPTTVENEETLTKNKNLEYFRITVTDGRRPTDIMVDRFISFIKEMPKDQWLHFHCKEGMGRTTTFMSMYDMMKNSKEVSFDDIISRQQNLANLEKPILEKNNTRRLFLDNFYNYTKTNSDGFKTTWSDYIKANNIEPYTKESELPKS